MVRKIENDRSYRYKSLNIEIEPEVFHPKYFDSSQMLLNWVETQEISGKTIIEVGCGSGITSLRAAQKGAKVWAVDINPKAITLLQKNAELNAVPLNVLESDLFEQVDNVFFDFVLINPPFYPKNPTSDAEKAWFCGSNFEYFEKLFTQLKDRNITSGIYMTLSDDCDLKRIQSIAKNYGYTFELREVKRRFFEKNFFFEVRSL
jgi:release factor glutamine methyltransferase